MRAGAYLLAWCRRFGRSLVSLQVWSFAGLGELVAEPEFESFVSARYGALVRRAYMLTGDVESARDLTQSALARLYPRWRRLRDPGAAEPYVHRIMLTLLLNGRRRSEPEVRGNLEDADRHDSRRPDPLGVIDDRLAFEALVTRLTPIQRAVLVLRYCDDEPISEVARALGCSESAVKTHTRRAVDRLRLNGALDRQEGKGHARSGED